MVVRIPNWLGDSLMALPVYLNLAKKRKIWLMGPPQILTLFKSLKNVETLPYDKGKTSLSSIKTFFKEKGITTGLLLPNSFSSAWIFFRTGLKERWGYATDLRGFLLTRKVKPPKDRHLHQRDYYLFLIKSLGLYQGIDEATLLPEEKEIERARKFLRKLGLREESFVVFAPGAAYGPAKKWPEDYYRSLAKALKKEGFKILILGSEKEKETGEIIKSGRKEIYNLCGQTSLPTAMAILYLSKGLVSNDSGLMHLGAVLKIPQVAIFGSTSPEKTAPLNPRARVLKSELPCSPCFKRTCKDGHYQCLKEILPEQVKKELLCLLD